MPAKGASVYSVSQNFLTSARTIRRLISLTSITKSDRVVEIGAGRGHITRALLSACASVRAWEIDPALCAALEKTLGGRENLTLVPGDFLAAQLPRSGAYKVFSNIPFSITTAIVKKLTSTPNPPVEAWLVMEKGAAKRFLGVPRETGMSLSIKTFFDARIAYHFARADFHPMPAVDCVLLHLVKKAQPDIRLAERGAFAAFVKSGPARFLTKKQIATALKLAHLPPAAPSGEMLYVQWLCLFRCHRHFCGK